MSKLVEIDRVQSKATYSLPPSFTREIGRIIVRWAFFERQVQQMIWGVAFNGDLKGAALGRLAILEAKFPDRLDLLAKLSKVRNVKYDTKVWKSIRDRSSHLSTERNLLAHGTWTKVPEYGWLVQYTRGAWETDLGPYAPSGSRKITPEALPRDASDMAKTVTALESLIEDARTLQLSLLRMP